MSGPHGEGTRMGLTEWIDRVGGPAEGAGAGLLSAPPGRGVCLTLIVPPSAPPGRGRFGRTGLRRGRLRWA